MLGASRSALCPDHSVLSALALCASPGYLRDPHLPLRAFARIAPRSALGVPRRTRISPCSTFSARCWSRIAPRSTLLEFRPARRLLCKRHLPLRAPLGSLRASHLPLSMAARIAPCLLLSVPRRTWITPRSTFSVLCYSPITRWLALSALSWGLSAQPSKSSLLKILRLT